MPSSGMEMVTVQVYSPPSDVLNSGKLRMLLSDCTNPVKLRHCTIGALIRLPGKLKRHSTVKGWPAVEVRASPAIVRYGSSAEETMNYAENSTFRVGEYTTSGADSPSTVMLTVSVFFRLESESESVAVAVGAMLAVQV